jgi:hypothetical protein
MAQSALRELYSNQQGESSSESPSIMSALRDPQFRQDIAGNAVAGNVSASNAVGASYKGSSSLSGDPNLIKEIMRRGLILP